MLRLVELVGLCAPLVGVAMVLYYRRRMGTAFRYAMAAAAVAVVGSAVGVVTGRAMWFGGGGAEGITERMEFGAGVRNLLVALAWALLLVAIARRPRVDRAVR
ncbi:hypothetical protein [Nocardia blacklockiae]|uniref:hypothetical protein n=1 Tax=Nocardia blacklockiae TaxID=480036 RepID=UPI001895A999|nr:hypothetical protein [Nocardia blacklockiae]MBF6172641.1 hypothetical protein [Nocardia blacklockiae]